MLSQCKDRDQKKVRCESSQKPEKCRKVSDSVNMWSFLGRELWFPASVMQTSVARTECALVMQTVLEVPGLDYYNTDELK